MCGASDPKHKTSYTPPASTPHSTSHNEPTSLSKTYKTIYLTHTHFRTPRQRPPYYRTTARRLSRPLRTPIATTTFALCLTHFLCAYLTIRPTRDVHYHTNASATRANRYHRRDGYTHAQCTQNPLETLSIQTRRGILNDITPDNTPQTILFDDRQRQRDMRLQQTIDHINRRFHAATLRSATQLPNAPHPAALTYPQHNANATPDDPQHTSGQPTSSPQPSYESQPTYQVAAFRTPSYTTSLADILTLKA